MISESKIYIVNSQLKTTNSECDFVLKNPVLNIRSKDFWNIKINPTQIWYESSIYLKTNKDYNNVFSEDGKIIKVGRSPEVL